jgi:tetratricopeptide (TPR) repeat protein
LNEEDLKTEAAALMKQSRFAEAAFLLSNSDTAESDFNIQWNLGWCHHKLGDNKLALRYLQRAREIDPQNLIASWALGHVYRTSGRLDEAENCWTH